MQELLTNPLVIIVIIVLLLTAGRGIGLWYWRVNEAIQEIQDQKALLKSIDAKLGGEPYDPDYERMKEQMSSGDVLVREKGGSIRHFNRNEWEGTKRQGKEDQYEVVYEV